MSIEISELLLPSLHKKAVVRSYADHHFLCYGKSKNGGVLLRVIKGNTIEGDSYENSKYGGNHIAWKTNFKKFG